MVCSPWCFFVAKEEWKSREPIVGGVVGRICVGPTVRDKNLNGVVYHGKLWPFDDLVVYVAAELAEARHENRPVDWHCWSCSHDMAAVRKIVGLKDFERSAQFILAVERAQQILHDNSCALACLTVRLKRPPFQIHADDFRKLMERLNVREISSDS